MLFYKICNVKVLDSEDAFAVSKAQQLFPTVNLKHILIYIKTDFSTSTTYIAHIKLLEYLWFVPLTLLNKITTKIQKALNKIG